ncbi:putative aldehyde dehydrogenase AldA [mine drainage metagenome]|uniref:Putative aldehyde dehydrogenase AldA n=1 Tax=mine drainage metagenome TaxID=410659 RepID=A0A1J5NWE2_9ZZZZ
MARAAAENLTPCSFELGGKSPTIIFDDADLDLAVDLAIEQYDNAGQVCLAGTRLLVQNSIAPMFIERFKARVETIKQGDPRILETDMGPQIHQEHFDRIKGFVDRARSAGSEIAFGGRQNEILGGLYFRPTLIVEPEAESEIVTAEVFGPVLTLQTFNSDEDAIAMANSTEFGLAGVVVCGHRGRAEHIAERLVAGTVWINCFFVRDLQAPFGGAKKSGIGREGGTWSFDFYSDVKNTVFAPTGWKE